MFLFGSGFIKLPQTHFMNLCTALLLLHFFDKNGKNRFMDLHQVALYFDMFGKVQFSQLEQYFYEFLWTNWWEV